MADIQIPVTTPRPYQMDFWRAMDEGARYAVISWHRRAGKDLTCFSFMVRQALLEVGTYYYCFPTLEDGKEILWDSITTIDGKSGPLVDLLCPASIVKRKNNSDHFIELINGSLIRMKGTDSGKVVGNDGKGFVFSEWQNQKSEMFDYIRPILRQNDGWAIFNGTMRGKENHLYKDIIRNEGVHGWFSQWLRPEDTKQYYWVTPPDTPIEYRICVNPELEGQINPDTGKEYDNIQWQVDSGASHSRTKQEFLNEAVQIVGGTYYAYELKRMELDGRTKAKYDPRSPVYTFWDLGGDKQDSDKTCILFAQMHDNESRVEIIDYYENSGHLRGHYFDELGRRGYQYGGHYIPHDGKRSNVWTGEDMRETARKHHGIELQYIPKTNSVLGDIEITRQDFVNWAFDTDACSELITHLNNYHESETTGKPCHRNNCSICHGASHGADSARMMAMARHLKLVEAYLTNKAEKRRVFTANDDWVCC